MTLHALARAPDPTVFRGIIFAGTPFHGCVNVLGPIKKGDSVLVNREICSPSVVFCWSLPLSPHHKLTPPPRSHAIKLLLPPSDRTLLRDTLRRTSPTRLLLRQNLVRPQPLPRLLRDPRPRLPRQDHQPTSISQGRRDRQRPGRRRT